MKKLWYGGVRLNIEADDEEQAEEIQRQVASEAETVWGVVDVYADEPVELDPRSAES